MSIKKFSELSQTERFHRILKENMFLAVGEVALLLETNRDYYDLNPEQRERLLAFASANGGPS